MSEREIGDNGNFADLFFASILDPEANVRRLTAIQAEGFRAASELVDRFVQDGVTRPATGRTTRRNLPLIRMQEDNNGDKSQRCSYRTAHTVMGVRHRPIPPRHDAIGGRDT